MKVTQLTPQEQPAWDAFVQHSPHGLPHHLSGWRTVMEASYGYRTHFLLARNEDEVGAISGVMPLLLVPSLLTGRAWMTLPGGLCADSEAAASALLQRAQEIARSGQAKRLLLQDSRHAWPGDLHTVSNHVAWLVDVHGTQEELERRLHRNVRRQIRMARNNGLTVTVDRSGHTLDDFYHVMSHFTHQAGTPVFGRHFVQNVVDNLPGQFSIVTVYSDAAPIGSYFQLELGDTVYGLWGATLHEYLELRPVYLAYWTILADAVQRGFTQVDMGRSPVDSNAAKFKRQWGGESVPIYQQSMAFDGTVAAGITERTQNDGKLQSFMQLWPKIPFPVAQFLGPKLRRHVPFA